jgi:hypothetical protein
MSNYKEDWADYANYVSYSILTSAEFIYSVVSENGMETTK